MRIAIFATTLHAAVVALCEAAPATLFGIIAFSDTVAPLHLPSSPVYLDPVASPSPKPGPDSDLSRTGAARGGGGGGGGGGHGRGARGGAPPTA